MWYDNISCDCVAYFHHRVAREKDVFAFMDVCVNPEHGSYIGVFGVCRMCITFVFHILSLHL